MAQPLSPPHGEVRVVDDVATSFAELVASELAAFTAGAEEDRPFRFALSGGPTARRAYEHLATIPDLPWGRVDIFWGDERCVPFDDPDSNVRLAHEALLDQVAAVAGEHPMSCEDGPELYEDLMTRTGPLDLVHLGLGPDGHTASLFPGSAALEAAGDRLVLLNRDPAERNPHDRITLTMATLNIARLVVFTVSGEAKHDAFARVCAGDDLPAARVAARRVIWLVDRAAAGKG